MKKTIALFLTLALTLILAACGSKPATESAAPSAAPASSAPATAVASEPATEPAASDIKVGVILVGDENEGYTYAHIEGVEAAKSALGLTDEQVIYKYNVPEDETCYDTAVDLVEQGCTIIFANSFSHESYMWQAAEEYPEIMFCHATGQTAASSGLPNVCNYFTRVYESRYVSGVVAGLKLKDLMDSGEVTDPYIGYVGAYPYAEVVSGYTAFFLGIQSIVPEAHMDVTYTNSWFDITAEAEAANSLMSRGCVIIGQHADSTGAPSAVETALEGGAAVYSVGYNIDMLNVAPKAALTSSQNNWGVLYTELIKTAMDGGTFEKDYTVGYSDGGVMISALGESCAAGTADKVAEVEAAIKDGSLHVFDCSTFTVDGEHLDSYDQSYGFVGTQLIWDGYFHESEVVSAPLFDIRIDGITELN
jgi:basic membrane protein A